MNFYTYIHTRKDDLKVFYVGKGNGRRAWVSTGKGRSEYWKRVAAKHGHLTDICAYFETEGEAHEHERFLIQCFRSMGAPLVNLTDGGEGTCGMVHSAQARAKITAAGLGRRHTEASLAKMSMVQKGRKQTQEQLAKLSAVRKGRVTSDETRKKLSAARAGKPRILSDAARERIGAAHRGPPSEKVIAAIRKANTGREHSAEERAKRSAALKGRVKTPEHLANIAAARLRNAALRAQL